MCLAISIEADVFAEDRFLVANVQTEERCVDQRLAAPVAWVRFQGEGGSGVVGFERERSRSDQAVFIDAAAGLFHRFPTDDIVGGIGEHVPQHVSAMNGTRATIKDRPYGCIGELTMGEANK